LELADGEFQPEVEDEGKEEELSSEMVEKIKTTRESELQIVTSRRTKQRLGPSPG
jgi:hypothetical protein